MGRNEIGETLTCARSDDLGRRSNGGEERADSPVGNQCGTSFRQSEVVGSAN